MVALVVGRFLGLSVGIRLVHHLLPLPHDAGATSASHALFACIYFVGPPHPMPCPVQFYGLWTVNKYLTLIMKVLSGEWKWLLLISSGSWGRGGGMRCLWPYGWSSVPVERLGT